MSYIYVITFLEKLDYSLAFKTQSEAELVKNLIYKNDPDAKVEELEVTDIYKDLNVKVRPSVK